MTSFTLRGAALSVLLLTLPGCGSSNDAPSSAGGSFDGVVLNNGLPRAGNLLRVVDPTPDLVVDGHSPTVVSVRGFNNAGQQVFGPDEEPYDSDMEFSGLPDETTRVEVDYQRAQGFSLATHTQAVDFGKQDQIVLNSPSPRLLGAANRNTFTVRIVNTSDYPDDQVFVGVNGKNAAKTAFYYLKFGANDQNTSQLFGGKERFAEYSQKLSSLKKEGEHTYSFQCPRENLVSGRIYLSFGKQLQGIGLNNPSDPLTLALPSASGFPDAQTVWEFMELSATTQPADPNNYTLFANTSVVDFFSLGLKMTLNYQKNGANASETVGFVDNARNQILAAFEEAGTPSEFRNYVRKDGSNTILRVLGPHQAVAINPAGPTSQFLAPAINEGWTKYAAENLIIDDSLAHKYFYKYNGQKIVNDILRMTCVAKPPGDTAGGELESLNEVSALPKPTSRIIFFCDDDGPAPPPFRNTWKNLGSEGHKRLCSLLSAALNRGVFNNYADWNSPEKFYTRADGRYNHYAKIMHRFALAGKVYGFGYDDVYGQDPTLAEPLANVNQVVITIPPFPQL
jgi:hypothetical protein